MIPRTVGEVIDRHRVVVCVGTGGVGKTTVSAAVALGGALRGRRAVVLTIDPARQLARALGLEALAEGGERVSLEGLATAGPAPAGTLDAAMLDQKSAWDGFIGRHAPSPAVAERVLANPFYRQLSGSFAGATEYVAVEELCRLHESGRYDLIVLDTPPTGGALDFLRAPARIDRLLGDREAVRWLTLPLSELGRRASKVAGGLLWLVLRRLERATGSGTLASISDFFVALGGFLGEIERRTAAARALLHGPDSAFLLVAGPEARVLHGTRLLRDEITALDAPLRAVVMNRVHPLPAADPTEADITAVLASLRRAGAAEPALAWLERTFRDALHTARSERAHARRFEAELPPGLARATLAEGDHDLRSLADLADLARPLWPAPPLSKPASAPTCQE